MSKLLLLIGALLLAAGCSTEKKQVDPQPVANVGKSIISYQVNGQSRSHSATARYQPGSLVTNTFDVLSIEGRDTSSTSGREHVQIDFLKGPGRPDSEYRIISIRFTDSANNLTWGLSVQGTLGTRSGKWTGAFAGTATNQFGIPQAVITGEFSDVPN
ncbi:hypothetical protein J0X19_10920 [Hymenobacter sp. BT186]|uniref:Lipoprotein n=1 Tax=Hymenobacter telluris TaxID=2816474 RepID=A0A939EW04_9BACT|nr:hypothetical protein [Hymenobacter telluris]MBO0358458.1 hypothetical protein [Hymenobacter telluris]MBW3374484.1 hypothetical protein [Hymenobacter norwichensis]